MTEATAPRGKRMLIVEEALKSESGHWYEYVKSVTEMNRALGIETVVASHAETDPAIRDEINAHAIFPWTSWDGIYAHPKAWKRYLGIARHNLRVYRVMSAFIRRHGPFDIVFAPTVVVFHLLAWRALVARHRGGIGQLVLLFRNNAGSYPEGSSVPVFKRSADVLKWTMRSFKPLLKSGRVRFATDSAVLASEYEHLSGIAPETFPSPRISAPIDAVTRASDAPVTFSALGPARFEKGIDIMQEAICAYLAQAPSENVRFVIQWNDPITDADGAAYLPDPRLTSDPRVILLTEAMSSVSYDRAVRETDCMLMPYRRASYFARISGVAVEAATAGVPLIYTRDTWVEAMARDLGAGIGVADGDVAGLTAAIADMVSSYARYRAEAVARAEVALHAHSTEAFAAMMWQPQHGLAEPIHAGS